MADRKVIVLNSAGYQELFQGSDKLVLDGSAEFKSNVHIDGNLSVLGTSVTFDTVTLTVDDINIELGAIKEVHNIAVTPENLAYTLSDGSNSVTTSALGASPTIATLVTAIEAASGYSALAFTVTANANNNGIHLTYKTLGAQSESATLTKAGGSPISASAVTNVSDATANGGGFTLYGSTPKTFNWVSSTGSWTSSENIDLASGKDYKINGTSVLTNNTLGSGVTGSSLTSVGTITTGTWNGTAISQAYGGTGHSSYSNGQLLVGKADGTLAKAFLTQGTNTVITNGDGSIEIVAKDTTYTISAEQTGGSDANPDIKITAGGNGSTVSSTVALVGSGATSVTRNSGTQITVSSTDTTHTLSATEDSGDVRLSLDNSGGNVTLTGGTATTITRTSASEITITGQDTTYSAATTSAAGLMSATDKTQLDALHAGSNVNYLRANANDDFTGTLAHNNPGGVALYVRGGDSVTPLLRVSSQGADATATDTSGVYGFSLTYNGTGTGNNNTLNLYSDNQNAQSQTHVYSVTQDGVLDFKVAPTISSNAVLTSATTFGGDVSGTYNSIVVADNSHDHTIANITSLASTLAGKYATSGGSLSGKVTISAGSTVEPLLIEGSATAKIALQGATDPRIVLYEGTTEKGHLKWNSTGFVEIKNAEDASSLRVKDALDFSLDGSTYYGVFHEGIDIDLSDARKILLGTGDDLQIYHNGQYSFIKDTSGPPLQFISDSIDIQNTSGTTFIDCSSSAVSLKYSDSTKLSTVSAGVYVQGSLEANAGVTPGGNITMQDNEKIIFGAGNDLQIYHAGGTANKIESGSSTLYIAANDLQITNAGITEACLKTFANGGVELYYDNSKKFETTSSGVQVSGADSYLTMQATSASGNAGILFKDSSGAQNSVIFYDFDDDYLKFSTNTDAERLRISSTGVITLTGKAGAAANPAIDPFSSFVLNDAEARLQLCATDGGSNAAGLIISNESKHFVIHQRGPNQSNRFDIGYLSDASPSDINNQATPYLSITTDGKVGIGTTSISNLLHLNHSNDVAIRLDRGGTKQLNIGTDSSQSFVASFESKPLAFATSTSSAYIERMRIDSSGRLLINNTSATQSHPLQVTAASDANAIVINGRAADDIGELSFYENDKSTKLGELQYRQDHVNFRHRVGDIRFATGGVAERMRIDSSGRLLVGTTSAESAYPFSVAPKLQVESNNYTNSAISIFNNQNSDAGAQLVLGKSRGATNGSDTIVQSGDYFGTIYFVGADGTDRNSYGASIAAIVDGTPGSNDMPGRLVFSTCADGASSATERVRIDSSGRVGINTTSFADTATALVIKNGATNSEHTMLDIVCDTNETARVRFSEDGSTFPGEIKYTTLGHDLLFTVNSSERLRIGANGQIGLGGANYGTSGQVLTSNGSGSAPTWQSVSAGTDAGTLDGLDSSQFLRSDTADTMSGTLTMSGDIDLGSGNVHVKKTANTSGNYAAVEVYASGTSDSGAAIAIQQQTTEGDTLIFADYEPYVEWGISAENTSNEIHFTAGSSTSSLGSKTVTNNSGNSRTAYKKVVINLDNGSTQIGGTLTRASNTVWDAGNDGSGSGLDADTLDGVQGASYLRSDAQDTFSGNLVGGQGVNITLHPNIGEPGTTAYSSMSGYLLFDNDYSDSARGPNKIRLQSDGNWLSGLGISSNSTDIYTGGNFNFYKSVSTTSFTHLLSLSSDATLTSKGKVVINGSVAPNTLAYLNIGSSGSGETRAIDIDGDWSTNENKSISFTYGSNAADLVGQINCVHQNPGSMIQFGRLYHSGNSSVYPLKLYSTSASAAALSLNNNTVWHAGNDGSGSGLDADTLDGINSGSFLRSDATTTFNANGSDLNFDYDNSRTIWSVQRSGTRKFYLHTSGDTIKFTRANSGTLNFTNGFSIGTDTHHKLLHIREDSSTTKHQVLIQNRTNASSTAGIAFIASGSDFSDGQYAAIECLSGGTGTTSQALKFITCASGGTPATALTLGSDQTISGGTLHLGGSQIMTSGASLQVNGFMRTGSLYLHQGGGTPTSSSVEFSNVSQQPYWDTNKIWHAGNDGSGSGLDADTLDGLNSGAWIRADANSSSGTNVKTRFGGTSITQQSGSSAVVQINGFSRIGALAMHRSATPTSGNGAPDADHEWLTNIGGVLRWGTNASTADNKIWHAGNDGSGSGLDADTLDGINSGSFLRSDTNDSMSATNGPVLSITKTGSSPGNNHTLLVENTYGNHSWGITGEFRVGNQGSNDRPSILFSSGYNTTTWSVGYGYTDDNFRIKTGHGHRNNSWGTTRFSIDSSGNLYAGDITNKIWHAGNDGSGSGLDADTLDGKDSSVFLALQGSISTHNWNDYVDGTEASWRPVLNHSGSNRPSASYTYGTALSFSHTGYAKFQLYAPETGSSGNGLYYRTGWNTGYRAWVNLWDSGNDGAGSGLDADTVDGVQASSFLRSDASDTTTGVVTIQPNANRTLILDRNVSPSNYYNDVQLEIRATSNTAGIGLHRSGYSHVGIYHDTQNVLKFNMNSGTVTMNWNTGTIWGSGNDGSGSGLDADTVDGYHFLQTQGISAVGNFGQWQAHNTYTNFNSNISYWGWNFVMGNTNAPNTTSGQWYRNRVSLGSDYGLNYSSGHYWLEMAYPRSNRNSAGHLWVRTGENGSAGSWEQVGSYLVNSCHAPIFYDINNTAYYCDPASTSNLNGASFNGKVDFQGDAAIEGGTGYGIFKGYSSNNNHMLVSRGIVTGSTSSPTITAGHDMTFCEYLNSDSLGFSFKRTDTGTFTEVCRITRIGLTHTGNITAYSDLRLKENIEVIPNALDKIKTLRGVTYNRTDFTNKNRQSGVIAQEVEKVLPEVVQENDEGIKSVAYGNMVGLLIEAIKEQQKQIDEQQKQIDELKAKLL